MLNDVKKSAVALFIASESSFDRQNLIREYATKSDLTIISFLAMDQTNIVSGMNHAIDLCIKSQASYIIVDEPAALAIPLKELINVIDRLANEAIHLSFAIMGLRIDTNSLMAFRAMIMASQTADNQLRSAKIKKSLLQKKRKGLILGGRKFGREANELKIINQILNFHTSGYTLQKICDLLTQSDIKTVQNKKWHPTTIKRILERTIKN